MVKSIIYLYKDMCLFNNHDYISCLELLSTESEEGHSLAPPQPSF